MLSPTQSEPATQGIEACPACGSSKNPAIGTPGRGFESIAGAHHFFQPDYLVRGCNTCGLLFKSAAMSAPQLDRYYRHLDAAVFEHDGNFPTDQILRRRLERLPPQSRVLDFGCSTGRLLKGLTSRLACAGVEPNEAAAAVARERGIEIVNLDTLRAEARLFDAILLADVYEHLAEPVPVLERLKPLLAPGGWLAIVTGDADAVTPRHRAAEFWYFRLPGHLLMASERHFTWLAQRVGLTLASVRRCSHYDTPAAERWSQCIRAYAYDRFRDAPSGLAARVMRLLPRLKAAEGWATAPAVTYRNDHLVAIFSPPATASMRKRNA
jgi:SAM-dependent methyltransferase